MLDGVEEEQVKTSKQKRAMELFQQRLVTGREVTAILRNDNLLTMETEVGAGLRDVEPVTTSQSEPSDSSVTAGDKEEKKAVKKT